MTNTTLRYITMLRMIPRYPRTITANRLLKRRQAVEPSIDHLKADPRLRRNSLKDARGDAMNSILAATGFNHRWPMLWPDFFWRWLWAAVMGLVGQTEMEDRSAMASASAQPKCSGTTRCQVPLDSSPA